ncbi:hypothetical protein E2C01_068696 [Portunus trituberculatus]|uniref:Uncharacterized protein n=1 Tax=Portunus trituberculatus TaxID=210409 RepID=A0A5B7I066_PORTR|nr:hypothetical protein [Portunus trituberculatus]
MFLIFWEKRAFSQNPPYGLCCCGAYLKAPPPLPPVPLERRYWCDILCFFGRSLFNRVCQSEDNSCYLSLCWGGWSCSSD